MILTHIIGVNFLERAYLNLVLAREVVDGKRGHVMSTDNPWGRANTSFIDNEFVALFIAMAR